MSDKPVAYQEQGQWVWRMSEFGGCALDIVAAMMGKRPAPVSEQVESWWAEGNLHEPDILERLGGVTNQQQMVELWLVNGVVRGHIDGTRGGTPVEAKAVSKLVFEQVMKKGVIEWIRQDKDQYAWQVSGIILTMDAPVLVAVKSRDSGKLVTEMVSEPYYSYREFEQRAEYLLTHLKQGKLPECEGGFCWNGPYRQLHPKKDPDDRRYVTNVKPTPDHLKDVASRMFVARNQRISSEKLEKALKEELMVLEDGEYIGFEISEGSMTRVDEKRVREEWGDRYDKTIKYRQVKEKW